MVSSITLSALKPRDGPRCKVSLNTSWANYRVEALAVLKQACGPAKAAAHRGQKRAPGEPDIVHPLVVAALLHEFQMGCDTLAAASVHDVVEDTPVTPRQIDEVLSSSISALVSGMTGVAIINELQSEEWVGFYHRKQGDALLKRLFAIADDLRVVLIKLADRLYNVHTLHHLTDDKRQRIAGIGRTPCV